MRILTSLLLMKLCLSSVVCLVAQSVPAANADAADQAKRQKAVGLFNQGKRLEALPLLEELAQKDAKDSEVLVALAAALVDHAATLTDPDAAAKDRFRARDLLQQAWSLGNTSPLAENLRQLLGDLPANGAVKFSSNPAVEKIMDAGEAAFARRDFDDALTDYAKALELEPTNYSAVLFTGNTYDRENDFPKASEWYERAMRLDPNVETAYRYYADMLAKQGDMAKARSMLVRAAVAEPYNKIVWREIRAWATINKTEFNVVFVAIPLPRSDDTMVGGTTKLPPGLAAAWRTYYSTKADWKKGGKFVKLFPQEGEYRHSLAEESEALTATAKFLKKLLENKKTADVVTNNTMAELLVKLQDAGLIDAYVLFSLGDDDIAKDYIPYREKNRDKLEAYMDKFAIPPAPAAKNSK
jgi:tetratricopeptide (TPR) repeat protein